MQALQGVLHQAACSDLRLIIRSKALFLKLEAADHMVKFLDTTQDSERVEAMVKADQARICEEFLALLDEVASGNKRGTGEPFEYVEAVIRVAKV